MSDKRRKSYSREFKLEAVRLITEKGYSIAEASKNLGIEYSVLRRWKKQLADDPDNAFPGKGKLKAQDEQMRKLQRKLERVKEARDILKNDLRSLHSPMIRETLFILGGRGRPLIGESYPLKNVAQE